MHTAYIYKIKEENLPKLSVYRIWRKSLRTQERVRLIHGKRAIGVRAIEVLLHYQNNFRMLKRTFWCLALILLLTIAYETYAGVTGRSESDDIDADLPSAQNQTKAFSFTFILSDPSKNCTACNCTRAEECPNVPDMNCFSAVTYCCCCTSQLFPCREEYGVQNL